MKKKTATAGSENRPNNQPRIFIHEADTLWLRRCFVRPTSSYEIGGKVRPFPAYFSNSGQVRKYCRRRRTGLCSPLSSLQTHQFSHLDSIRGKTIFDLNFRAAEGFVANPTVNSLCNRYYAS
ncbi:hypothetical protein ABKV19_027478 [Rosa sericea]